MSASPETVIARAKINLTLHVGAALTKGLFKGYHPLDSLVVFADFGDELSFERASKTTLSMMGEFASGLSPQDDNLILRALKAAKAPSLSVALNKVIPVSAGLGGGSANAAAILRLFDENGSVDAAKMGADIPVCRLSQTAMMQGIGEDVTALPGLGQVSAILVNPRQPVSTAAIFKNFDTMRRRGDPIPTQMSGTLLERAQAGRNDLEHFAIEQAPVILDVLNALDHTPDRDLFRMSGSGATCFALYPCDEAAQFAAAQIKRNHSEWWVRACRLGDMTSDKSNLTAPMS